MKSVLILLASLLLVVSITLLWIDLRDTKANSIFLDSYVQTKAFCNETNYCQDYQIECQGNQATRINPVTGAFLQQSENWQDPREEEIRKTRCK